MRVTGGRFSGRQLKAPKGPRVRPTQDRVRQALFNLLGEAVRAARALDLFCGSGALGLEALSRGASHVTFVDRSRFCIQAVEANLKNLMGSDPKRGQTPLVSILETDAITAIRKLARQGESFGLLFLDPPYGQDWARKSLIALGRYAIVSPLGWVVVEADKRDFLPVEVEAEGSQLISQRIEAYGDTALTLYRRQ